jgi:mono/diheme cytochrome c family protein
MRMPTRQPLTLALLAGSLLLGANALAAEPALQLAQAVDQATLVREGQPLYARNCAVCHGANGEGGAGPKLIAYEFLGRPGAVIAQIFVGNEEKGMPPFKETLNDRQVAAIGTYVRNAWGNKYGVITPDEVKTAR